MTNENNETMESQENVDAVEGEVVEEASAETGSNSDQPSYNELVLALKEAKAKADESRDQVLRIQAELENTRRRAERDVQAAHKFALEKFVNELLPVKDSLEMGLAAASEEGTAEEAVKQLREGTELTLKMLTSAMEKFGIKEINPQGQPFDPELHQAMTMQASDEHPPNTVIAVMQKGYTLNDRLMRPAMVMVSKAKD